MCRRTGQHSVVETATDAASIECKMVGPTEDNIEVSTILKMNT